MFPQTEMLDLVLVNGHAKGIITRSLRTGEIRRFAGDAVVLATGGYGNVFYLSTNARGCNVTATYQCFTNAPFSIDTSTHTLYLNMGPRAAAQGPFPPEVEIGIEIAQRQFAQ